MTLALFETAEARPRYYFESLIAAKPGLRDHALVALLLKEAARRRRAIAKHGWKWSAAWKGSKAAEVAQIVQEARALRENFGLRLP